jgi:hypothetical protein
MCCASSSTTPKSKCLAAGSAPTAAHRACVLSSPLGCFLKVLGVHLDATDALQRTLRRSCAAGTL